MQRAIKELYVTRDDKHSIKTRPPLARLSVSKVFWVFRNLEKSAAHNAQGLASQAR